jgi:divalent metal cation (Fe/Co/Zn/Cd) transporter
MKLIRSILFAVCFGLFVGLIVFGTLRIALNSIFNWGDSGPVWINWLIIAVAGVSIFISAYIFNSKMTSPFRKKAN